LDLYARRFEGKRLRPDEYVISADEKTQLQALGRHHETIPPGPGRPGLVEFEYLRGGTLAYLAIGPSPAPSSTPSSTRSPATNLNP
jgi:hypothetical protein